MATYIDRGTFALAQVQIVLPTHRRTAVMVDKFKSGLVSIDLNADLRRPQQGTGLRLQFALVILSGSIFT